MTEKLKTLLHEQATIPDFVPVDLGTITTTGDRRVRRRRVGLVGAVAVVALAGGVVLAASGGGDAPRVADRSLPTDRISWAQDATLHVGDATATLDRPIRAYVRTDAGYVIADADGAVWSIVDGRTTRVGDLPPDALRLVGDADGSLVAWVDTDASTSVTVLDLSDGDTRRFDAAAGVDVRATDGRTVYWSVGDTSYAADLDRGATEAVAADVGPVVAAEDGVLARETQADDLTDGAVVVVGPEGRVQLSGGDGSTARFSPDARHLSLDADQPVVYDVASGRRVTFDVGERSFGTGLEWLDADTLVMIAAKTDNGPVELLQCAVPAGTCVSQQTFGTFEDFVTDHALPFGEPFED